MSKQNDKILMLVTAGSTEEASKIGKALVENRLAACCSIIPALQSIYWWEGTITEDAEVLLLIKSVKSVESKIMETVKSLHSYKVPEIITISLQSGLEQYFQWIDDNVKLE